MFWAKWDKFKVTERRGGAIYKTAQLGSEWFEVGKDYPQMYKEDSNGEFWVPTCETRVSKERPKDA